MKSKDKSELLAALLAPMTVSVLKPVFFLVVKSIAGRGFMAADTGYCNNMIKNFSSAPRIKQFQDY